MNKKMMYMLAAIGAVSALSMTAFAADATPAPIRENTRPSYTRSCCGAQGGYGMMYNEEGELLDRQAFEEKLDEAVAAGEIDAGDRDFFLGMYERCVTRGGRGMMGRGRGLRGGR